MDITADIREQIHASIGKRWPEIEVPSLEINTPPKAEFGDYTCPVSLSLAKLLGEKPMAVAEEIVKGISPSGLVANVTVTAPGFINFFLDYPAVAKELISKDFSISESENKNISVEHTSVNPNKAAHVGHLRNAVLGDTLARILRAQGNTVEVQNYIDDLGLQVADGVVAAEVFGMPPEGEPIDEWFWKIYSQINQEYESRPELKERRTEVLHEMEGGENRMAQEIVAKIVPAQLKTFEKFGIQHDLLTYEHDVVNNHLWEDLFVTLKKKSLIHKPDKGPHEGAWVVEFGETEREDMILVRSNGLLTYTGKDLPLALWKFGKTIEMKGYEKRLLPIDKHINVIDERQSYPQSVIRHVMKKLGYEKEADNYLHLGYGVVRLSQKALEVLGGQGEGKSSYSMSGRSGIGIMVNDLYKAALTQQKEDATPEVAHGIAIGSIRYYMLRSRPEREIIFDFEDALRSDGNTGVYLQYAYARANNILEKFGKVPKATVPTEINLEEKALIKTMTEVNQYVTRAAQELDPSIMCDYAYGLANAFAKFYETSPVIKAEESVRDFRLQLTQAFIKSYGRVLDLLGVPTLGKM